MALIVRFFSGNQRVARLPTIPTVLPADAENRITDDGQASQGAVAADVHAVGEFVVAGSGVVTVAVLHVCSM